MRLMKSIQAGVFTLTIAPCLAVASANATDTFVVHGIPGQDLGLAPELTVDIAANGACLLPGAEFGNVAGPVDITPNAYDFEVRLADAGSPCSGPIAITGSGDIGVAPASIVIAHLDQNGGPKVTEFTTKTSAVDPANARLTVYHTAAAPAVDLRLNLASDNQRGRRIPGPQQWRTDLSSRPTRRQLHRLGLAGVGEPRTFPSPDCGNPGHAGWRHGNGGLCYWLARQSDIWRDPRCRDRMILTTGSSGVPSWGNRPRQR